MPLLSFDNLKRVVKDPLLLYKYPSSVITSAINRKKIISTFFDNNEEFDSYKQEVIDSGIIDELNEKKQMYEQTVTGKNYRGNTYCFGAIRTKEAIAMYSIIRKKKPQFLVETGVCNGFSTAFLLLALHKNNEGKLYSIDFPEIEGKTYQENQFWDGKRGAAVPHGKQPGWVIPDYLRGRWELTLGKTKDKLPALLKKLRTIDFFFRDSEHTYECMWFEFHEAFNALCDKGILVSDDTNYNSSFDDFCKKHGKKPLSIGAGMELFIK